MRIRPAVTLALFACLVATSCRERASPPASIAADTRQPAKPAAEPGPHFVDVAARAGLTTTLYCGGPNKDHILESVGSGAAFLDYDEDGWLDIFLVNGWALDEEPSRVRTKGRYALYKNLGNGRFADVTDQAGVAGDQWGCGVCAADYDGDGHVDLYVTCFGPNRLYRNRGDGTFEQVAERAGVAEPGWGAGACFFDADGDGDLDLYVANYIDATLDEVLSARRTSTWRERVKVMAGPFGLRGGKDRFFRNNGDGTFADATEAAGMKDVAESYGLGVLASDLDNDGDLDVYVANDSNPNFLYRNEGDGTFTEIGSWSGAGLSGEGLAQAGMGVDAADFDGDGSQELFVTNFARDHCTLYHNMGGLLFTDISESQNLIAATYEPVSWGCAFLDCDNDADLDLVIVNGHIYPQVDQDPELHESYRQLPILMRNEEGHLKDVSRKAGPGFQTPLSARGLAVGDYDNDGDLDLLITAIDAPPVLLRNETQPTRHWVKIRLLNAQGSPAINARVLVSAQGRTQLREIRSGSSYESQNELAAHFGLGSCTQLDRVEVIWPDGRRTQHAGIGVDQTSTIRAPASPTGSRKPNHAR